MRTYTAAFLSAVLALVPLTTQSAGTDNTLSNLRGTLQFQTASGAQTAVPLHGEFATGDQGTAITGNDSQAAFTLEDSSRVLIGMNTNVHLASFARTDTTTASFVVVGKVRFRVEHPQGAKANYTFQTSTAQIAVRGTEGDIDAQPGQLQVNCYALTDPNLPIHVALNNGQSYDLVAGQSLRATGFGQTITVQISSTTQPLFEPFREFGLPDHPNGLVAEAPTAAGIGASAVTSALVVGGAVAGGLLLTSQSSHTPSPAQTLVPASTPTLNVPVTPTTGAPITVTSRSQAPPQAAPPVPSPQLIAPHPPGPGGRVGPP